MSTASKILSRSKWVFTINKYEHLPNNQESMNELRSVWHSDSVIISESHAHNTSQLITFSDLKSLQTSQIVTVWNRGIS